ncbi:MAG TPA: choice-of-anchor Q domain-containing protein [Gemmata sp.]|nr:choice-of-anchor Q domain-containing protein [Gemmata sp.]
MPQRRNETRLQIENLEERTVPAVYKVISLADNNSPVITSGHTGTAANPYIAPSLRAAITAANASAGADTIELAVAGTYKITLAGADEGNNASGSFDILASGGNLSIVNTSGGVVAVDGNHLDRVFDINPNPNPTTAPFTVTMQGFTIQNGYVNSTNNPSGSGGGIRDSGNASLTLTNIVIQNNNASQDGGGIAFENIVSAPWVFTANNSAIRNNHAGNSGGGIATDGSGMVNINAGTVISGNTAVNSGGGIWLNDISGVVTGVTVTDTSLFDLASPPTVTFTSVDGKGSGAEGTAIVSGGKLVGVQITNPGSGYDQPPTVTFSTNTPNITGVATIAQFESATLNVNGATISNNYTHNFGGGIGNAGNGAATIANSTVSGNYSLYQGGGYGDENNRDTLTVQNSLFVGNVSTYVGGGIAISSQNATIENSTFRDNLAAYGGGVYTGSLTDLLLTNDLFVQNTGYNQGGGLEVNGPLTNGTNLELRDNNSGIGGFGGGLIFLGETLNLTGVTFSDNTSSGSGGGLEFGGTGNGAQESTITNSTFYGNNAFGSNGGGIDFSRGNGGLVLINDTITGNMATASGGGVFWSTASATTLAAENTIFAGNSSGTGGDVANPTGMIEDLGGNIVGQPAGSTGFTASTTQLNVDPLFGNFGNNGGPTVGVHTDSTTLDTQAILPGSPAIGHGVEALTPPALDERGYIRPSFAQGMTLDVGAFDTNGLAPTSHSTVPSDGDTNPYGVAFVPANFPKGGVFQPGALIVTNFNNAAGTQGLGTTLVQINSTGAATTLFKSAQPGLSAALGFLKAGFVIVGNVPNVKGTPEVGSLQILNKYGQLVATIATKALDGPWYLTVANDTGSTAQVFVSNVLSGTVVRLGLSIQNNTVKLVGETIIASGYGHRLDPAAFVVGPAGLAYNAATNVLYVASSVDDAVYAIANASTTTTDGGMGTLVVNGATTLHGPLGLVIAPNGNLLIANSDAQNVDPNNPSEISEFTTSGKFLAQFPVDPANGGAFGLGFKVVNGQLEFAAVDDNTTTITTWGL